MNTIESQTAGQMPGILTTVETTRPYARRRKWYIAAVILQVGALATLCSAQAFTLITGTRIAVHASPVDPTDMFRGDYLTLNLDVENIPIPAGRKAGDIVYVVLKKAQPYWTFERVEQQMPVLDSEHVALRGKIADDFRGAHVNFGLQRAYIPEGSGANYSSRAGLEADVAVDRFGNSVLYRVQKEGE